jgi:hypothetical protein
VVGPSPGSGEAVAPPRSRSSLSSEVKDESEPRVGRGGDHRLRTRLSLSLGVERGGVCRLPEPRPSPSPGSSEAEFVVFRSRGRVRALGSGETEFVVFRNRGRVRALGRARRSLSSSGAEAESELWGRARRSSSSSGAEAESEPWGQARWCSSSSEAEAETGAEPWGRARRSFLWRPKPDLAAVNLTLSSGTAVGAAQAALSSCQAGHWSSEVTAVTSALSTGGRASG